MKKWIISVCMILVLVLCPVQYRAVSESTYLSDGTGNLYCVQSNTETLDIWRISGNEQKLVTSAAASDFDKVFCTNGGIYLTKTNRHLLCFQQIMSDEPITDTAEIYLHGDYTMAAVDDTWYFTDTANPYSIIQYSCYDRECRTIHITMPVKAVFTDMTSQKVFGIGDNGIWDIDGNVLIPCTMPVLPLKWNGSICTDGLGDVYIFTAESGFVKVLDTEYDSICACGEDIYVLEDGDIYCIDKNGSITAEYHTDVPVCDIMASGNRLYAVNDAQVYWIDCHCFVSREMTSSAVLESEYDKSDNVSAVGESEIVSHDNPPVHSGIELPVQEYGITDSIYDIDGNIIYLPQGTTVAQFKKGIGYGDGNIAVTNHNGKMISSGKIGTGWQIDFTWNGGHTEQYYTVVTGDVTGEGNINFNDVNIIKNYLFDKTELSAYQCIAADIKQNGIIDSVDMYLLHKKISS